MAAFGRRSENRLRTAHPMLQKLFRSVVKDYDCTVLEGFRAKRRQNLLFASKRSKVQWPNSRHNRYPSDAVDVAPYNPKVPGGVDWENTKVFYHFAGFVEDRAINMGVPLVWGGDWDADRDLDDQAFMDLVHFQLND